MFKQQQQSKYLFLRDRNKVKVIMYCKQKKNDFCRISQLLINNCIYQIKVRALLITFYGAIDHNNLHHPVLILKDEVKPTIAPTYLTTIVHISGIYNSIP